jgi:hypothetical protein
VESSSGGPDEVGLTRRSALKRGVALGVAVWAVPAVEILSISPASAQGASPTGGGFPSNVQLIVQKTGSSARYGVKFDPGDATRWGRIPPSAPMCPDQFGVTYLDDNAVITDFNRSAVVTTTSVGGKATFRIQIPAGYALAYSWSKCGRRCIGPGQVVATRTYDFNCG